MAGLIEFVPIVPSPCVNICRMDDATGWCEGCGRTLDEIARWGATDDADRVEVMARLADRMAGKVPANQRPPVHRDPNNGR